jgi:hypothetical protein
MAKYQLNVLMKFNHILPCREFSTPTAPEGVVAARRSARISIIWAVGSASTDWLARAGHGPDDANARASPRSYHSFGCSGGAELTRSSNAGDSPGQSRAPKEYQLGRMRLSFQSHQNDRDALQIQYGSSSPPVSSSQSPLRRDLSHPPLPKPFPRQLLGHHERASPPSYLPRPC